MNRYLVIFFLMIFIVQIERWRFSFIFLHVFIVTLVDAQTSVKIQPFFYLLCQEEGDILNMVTSGTRLCL